MISATESSPTDDLGQREHVDVLIVGAGISGIGCAYYLQRHHPRRSYAILEGRERIGGTWDLFRYPGIRSDSDLHTFGFEFKPWRSEYAIADGSEILEYIRETASENGIDKRIRTGRRVTAAAWSSDAARWTVTVTSTDSGEQSEITCNWLFTGTGYYHYDAGYTPELPGLSDFEGQVVHPQRWPEDLDYDGKRVVVIGSGATAVTLIPAMAQRTAQITMLQRSPSYIMSLPQKDPLANLANRILGPERGYALARRKNIALQTGFYRFCQRFPRQARALIRRLTVRQLPEGYPVDEHFRPRYDPWDQRVCIVPNGDLFRAIRQGEAEVVTDTIAGFTANAIKLSSGRELEADIVITATGLRLLPLGGIAFSVDGRQIDLPSTLAYKGMMLSGIPNFVFLVGYTNASWTLKVGLVCEHFMRLLSHMDARGYDQVVPVPDPHALGSTRPLLDFSAGYVTRSVGDFPRQGVSAPWQLAMNPKLDRAVLRQGPIEDPALRFSGHRGTENRRGQPSGHANRGGGPSRPASALAPEPPGPPLRDTPRWLGHIQRDVLGSFDALAEEFGDVAMVRLGPRRMIVFRSAEAARHILVTAQDRYPKAENFKLLRTVLGLGLVTSEGEVWRKSRRMVQPLFAKRHLGAYANHMSGAAATALDRWEAGWPADQRIDIDKEILHVGLDTVGRALVTHDFGDRAELLEQALAAALDEIGEMSGHPGVLVGQEWRRLGAVRAAKLTVPHRWRRLSHAGATIDSLIAPIVEDRIQNGQRDYDDLVRLLMETVDDETGTKLSTRQVIDEVKTFIAAGHETTAHGLTWMFLLLAENPTVRARVYDEVDRVLQGRRPTAESVEQLPLLQAAFLEAMRIYPPVWAVPRFAAEEDQIGDFLIKRGSRIMISIWSMHHDPRVFPDPMEYQLERWLDDADKHRPRLAYMPFGGGRRACIGQGFALLNAAVLGAMMIQRYEFDRATSGPIALEPTVTLRPLTGVPMIARRRPQPAQEVSNDAIETVQA